MFHSFLTTDYDILLHNKVVSVFCLKLEISRNIETLRFSILGKLYIGTVIVIGYFIFRFRSLDGFRLLSSPSLLFTKCFQIAQDQSRQPTPCFQLYGSCSTSKVFTCLPRLSDLSRIVGFDLKYGKQMCCLCDK